MDGWNQSGCNVLEKNKKGEYDVPFDFISEQDYAKMDGQSILKQALTILGK